MNQPIFYRLLSSIPALVASALIFVPSSSQADVLYAIESFNNNATDADVWWTDGITDITVAPGLVGTTEDELVDLQTVSENPRELSGAGGDRFRNGEPTQNSSRGTLTTDIGRENGERYWQCGVSGGTMQLTSLTFDAVRATGGDTTRGYEIDMSIDGGEFINIGSSDIANNRNDGLQSFEIALTDTATTSVDFRFYASGGGIEWTNIVINGTSSGSAASDFRITEIILNPDGSVELTWTSSPVDGTVYSVFYNEDFSIPLEQWGDASDSVGTGGETTSLTVTPDLLPPNPEDLFFVVRLNTPSGN